jgi:diguanylate cyclase (GGDEF)-like protein
MLVPNLPVNLSNPPHALLSFEFLNGPLREKFERITRITANLFDVPMAGVSFIDEHCKQFKTLFGTEVIDTPHEISFCSHVLNQEEIFNVPETFLDERFCNNPHVIGDPHVRFYAGCSIQLNRQKLGTISIMDQKPRHFDTDQLDWLRDIAVLAETEIQNYAVTTDKGKLASDLDQARMASMVDPLTSLWNRQGIYNILRYRMDEYLLNGMGFAVAILDIDNFKAINDTYGHDAGDHTLQAIAQSLIKGCRESDAIGRWGGEEFLLLINESSLKNVMEIAQRIRTTIESHQILLPNNRSKNVTVTIGLTCITPETRPTLEELINWADQALYKGKRGGRNLVVAL